MRTHTHTNRGVGVYVSKHDCMTDLAVKLEPNAQQLTDPPVALLRDEEDSSPEPTKALAVPVLSVTDG